MTIDSRIRTFLPWAAAVFFSLLFHFRGLGPLDFSWGMGTVIAVLIGTAVFADASFTRSLQKDLKVEIARKVALGVLTAAFLYGVFYLGNGFARSFLPFAGDNIGAVYGLRSGVSPLRVGLLLAFLIGPGEEIFWRGWLQRSWQERFGPAALPVHDRPLRGGPYRERQPHAHSCSGRLRRLLGVSTPPLPPSFSSP